MYRSLIASFVVIGMVASSSSAALVSHWTFDENSGMTAADSVGVNHGTLNNMGGTEWTSSGAPGLGGALEFDGSDDYVYVPLAANMSPGTGVFSYAMWMTITNSGVVAPYFFGEFDPARAIIETYVSGSTGFSIDAAQSSPQDGLEVGLSQGSNIRNKLALFVGVREADMSITQYIKTYDGAVDDTGNSGGVPPAIADITPTTEGLNIARSVSNTRYMEGTIADLKYYNHSLTSADVDNLFAAASVVPEPSSMLLALFGLVGLAGLWRRRRQR